MRQENDEVAKHVVNALARIVVLCIVDINLNAIHCLLRIHGCCLLQRYDVVGLFEVGTRVLQHATAGTASCHLCCATVETSTQL